MISDGEHFFHIPVGYLDVFFEEFFAHFKVVVAVQVGCMRQVLRAGTLG